MKVVAEVVSPRGLVFEVREMVEGDKIPRGTVSTYETPGRLVDGVRRGVYDTYAVSKPTPADTLFRPGYHDRFRLYYVGKANPEWGEVSP